MSKTCKHIYITTPIYYVNDVAHIGHAYTTIIADTLSRYSRLIGFDTMFLTGTDEYGQKIQTAALKQNKTPKEYVDYISLEFRKLWEYMDISFDKFIRTTQEDHKKTVQKAFDKMYENEDIYKGVYRGNYCIHCESFFTLLQLTNSNLCPDCGRETQIVEEDTYFFRLSKYQQSLLKWYQDYPDCILPTSKKNELVNFVRSGLNDLSITRTGFKWGIKIPKRYDDEEHIIYVWVDALLNYLSAIGYLNSDENIKFWPPKAQIVGKDILKFHAVYWPAILMSLGLELPKHILAHGWWTRSGAKMSKSKGNIISPKKICEFYGIEPFRYFLLREVPFGQDGDFSQKALISRINNDLNKDLGNLLNRLVGMSGKYFNYCIDSKNILEYHKKEVSLIKDILKVLPSYIYKAKLHLYLEAIWKMISIANQSITIYEPWAKIKKGKNEEAMALNALIADILLKVSIVLYPVMPKTSNKIAGAFSITINTKSYNRYIKETKLIESLNIKKIPPLFNIIEEELMVDLPTKNKNKASENKNNFQKPTVDISNFLGLDIKVGTIKDVIDIEESSLLYKIFIDVKESQLLITVASLKKSYTKKELIGEQVCVVMNLKPKKILGHNSNGMILVAKCKNKQILISPRTQVKEGASIK